MKPRTFAPWVAPIADRDRAARARLLEFARSVLRETWWNEPTPSGWTRREVLAHIAGDTGKWFDHILGSIVGSVPIDPGRASPLAPTDTMNAADIWERRDHSLSKLIAEIEADGQRHLDLLAQLADEHRDAILAPHATSVFAFLSRNPAGNRGAHDLEHLAELREV